MTERVLIVSGNLELFKPWADAARAAGLDPALATGAGDGLTRAVLSPPEIILFDDEAANLPAPQFLQILRANPKTAATPFVLVSNDPSSSLSHVGYRDTILHRNTKAEIAVAHVRSVLERVQRVRSVGSAPNEPFVGSLSQVPLPDLLQVLSSNRRTGLLVISAKAADGLIGMEDGQLLGARLGEHVREKAFNRMLAWCDVPFRFIPGEVPSSIGPTMSGSLASFILEGLHQNDELARAVEQLPLDTALSLARNRIERSDELTTTMREVVTLLEFYGSVREVLEHSLAADFDAITAIEELLKLGAIERTSQVTVMTKTQGTPLLAPEEVFELYRKMARSSFSTSTVTQGTLLLCAESFHPLRSFVSDLTGTDGFELHRDLLVRGGRRDGFGTLATVRLSDSVWVTLFAISPSDCILPLWRFFLQKALAVVVFLEGHGAPVINLTHVGTHGLPISYVRWISDDMAASATLRDGVPIVRESDRAGARDFLRETLRLFVRAKPVAK